MDVEMMLRKIVLFLILFLVVFAGGCNVMEEAFAPLPTLPATIALPTANVTATPWPTPKDSPTPTITITPAPTRTRLPTMTASATLPPIIRVLPNNFPEDTNPLTGYPVSDLTLLDRKPVIVKISNYPHSVRPQWGVSLADNIYEYYLEDGLTRFAAVFYGNNATQAGPIRSGRIFDATLMKMYNAIVVFNGADQKVVDYFNENNLTNDLVVERPGITPLWRDNTRPIPHNLFGNTAEISAYVTKRGSNNERPDLVTNAFYSIGNYGKDWAMKINVNYSYANYAYWEYDADSGRYLRYQGSADNLNNDPQYELLTDSLTGFPIAADNVVILFVPHEFFYKSSDTEIFDIKLVDRGDAYVFRDGKANPAIWVRSAENLPLSIQDTGGGYFPLKPGVTFFQILHTDSITIQDDSTWTFDFVRPTPPPE
jgi:hypothetical protein